MRVTNARRYQPLTTSGSCLKSLASRRKRVARGKLGSTTQRLGRRRKLRLVSASLTTA